MVLARIVAPDAHHLLDPPHSFRRPRPVDRQLDADDAAADHGSGERVARLMAQVARRKSAASALLACTVANEPPWPVAEGLQQVGRLRAAHLAHDDVVGAVAQGVAHRSRIVTSRPARPRASKARSWRSGGATRACPHKEDAALGREQRHKGIQERRLAGAGAVRGKRLPPLLSAARATTSAVSAGTARAVIRPARSTKTTPGR